MSDSTERFVSHFKLPKSEINKKKKEYQTAKESTEAIDPDKFLNFQELSNEVFDFFEEISGKKVHREVMIGHISHYLDEGFLPQEMIDLVRARLSEEYFRINPEKFTIANIFPIRDQDRINMCWDSLAHFQSLRGKKKKINGVMLLLRCGHKVDMQCYRESPICAECHEQEKLNEWYEKDGISKKDELVKLGYISEKLIKEFDAKQAMLRRK